MCDSEYSGGGMGSLLSVGVLAAFLTLRSSSSCSLSSRRRSISAAVWRTEAVLIRASSDASSTSTSASSAATAF
jgi:hypothetical protein